MKHKLFVNTLRNLSIPGCIRRSEVLTCHNTFGDYLVSHAKHKISNNSARIIRTKIYIFFFLKKKARRVGYLMVGFCNFAKYHPEKVISNLKLFTLTHQTSKLNTINGV